MLIEKRKNKRQNCAVLVEGKQGSMFDKTKTVDFCKGGFGFVSQNEVPIGEEITIEIDFGELEMSAIVKGKVKWVQPISESGNFRMGLSFISIERGSKSRLNKYFHNQGL